MAVEIPEPDQASEEALRDVTRRIEETDRAIRELRDAGRADAERTTGRARRERRRRQSWLGRSAARPLRSMPMPPHRRVPRKPPGRLARPQTRSRTSRRRSGCWPRPRPRPSRQRSAARDRLTGAEARAAESVARLSTARADVTGAEAHREALERRLRSGLDATILGAVEAAGGRRVDAGLEVEPDLRRAVAASLGDALTAMTAPASVIGDMRRTHGAFIIDGALGVRSAREREAASVLAAVGAAGGGPLVAAIRRDPTGHVSRLLERSVWVPDLAAAIALHPLLPPGWRVATPEGELVTDEGVVHLDPGQATLDVRAQQADLERAIAELQASVVRADKDRTTDLVELDAARAAVTLTPCHPGARPDGVPRRGGAAAGRRPRRGCGGPGSGMDVVPGGTAGTGGGGCCRGPAVARSRSRRVAGDP